MSHGGQHGDIDLTPGQPVETTPEVGAHQDAQIKAFVATMNLDPTVGVFTNAIAIAFNGGRISTVQAMFAIAAENLTTEQQAQLNFALGVVAASVFNFGAFDLNELNQQIQELSMRMYGVSARAMTDEEIEAYSQAQLNMGRAPNAGAGWGGSSFTNEGGIATINNEGVISWSGLGGRAGQSIAGAQSHFASGKDALDALANLFSGRTDNAPPATTPPDNPQGPGPGEVDT